VARKPKSKPREPLSRERVLRAAVVFADERGVEALSMRELARELGFGVMALYNHVANKDEMLDGMIEAVAGEIEAPASPTGDWKVAMRESAVSAHQVLLRHAWAAGMWSSRGPGPAKLRHMESILRGLREAGFSAETACRGFHAITTHILGFTLQKLDFPVAADALIDVAKDFLGQLDTEQYPYFTEHVVQHIDGPNQPDGFEFVLDLILDGLERTDDRTAPTAPSGS
jgi:AcrR family transcriptional regulator